MTYFTSRRTGDIQRRSMVRGRFGNLPSNMELALCWQQFFSSRSDFDGDVQSIADPRVLATTPLYVD